MENVNEVGASICRRFDGSMVLGPVSEGTPTSVNVLKFWPPGSVFEGIIHTHPNGAPIPSAQDLLSGLQADAKLLCINVPDTGVTHCYQRIN